MESPIDRARGVAERISPLAREIETSRELPPAAVTALVDAGLWKLWVPRAQGGAELSLAGCLEVIETIAAADGSAGWVTMIANTSALLCGLLPEAAATEIYGPADAVTCGVFAPSGRAVAVDGGWRVSGRWSFASGCRHAGSIMGGALAGGEPRGMLFRAADVRIHDTWDVVGLRGSGSHDIEVDDVFVPSAHSVSLFTGTHAIGAYRPFFAALAAGVAAVALGIGRGAIDAFTALASAKRPAGGQRTLAQRELVQLTVARAEARLGAARAYLLDTIAGLDTSIERRARVRLAACHAAAESAAAVDAVYEAGGGSSIYASNPLQRHFRDVHTATQHFMVGTTAQTLVGRILLGVDADTGTL